MSAIISLLFGSPIISKLLVGLVALIGAAATLFGIRRSGIKAGRAEAQAEGEAHVQASIKQADVVEQRVDTLSDTAARDELRRKWGRPDDSSVAK